MSFATAGYQLRSGSSLDRAQLVKFMQRTYQEIDLEGSFVHLARTVDQLFSPETPLWWVEPQSETNPLSMNTASTNTASTNTASTNTASTNTASTKTVSPIACLWIGNVVDPVQGDRYAHILLLYVMPNHRRKGIGSALVNHAITWAQQRGDRKIGLQVFQKNQSALQLYTKMGFEAHSMLMVKSLSNASTDSTNWGLD